MALWEYKVITSGKGGFATPQLLENFLNQLGKEEWEIVEFRSAPENFLCFTGLARRGVQRDWTLEAAAAAAAKAEAEQRRADERAAAMAREREMAAAPTSEPAPAAEAEAGIRDESFRRPRDTELDQDPEALADEAGAPEVGDWEDLAGEDEIPTLFEAVRPHLRRNQKGPGQSVAIDYLAKRWEQDPDDITGALVECGFTVPETEDSPPDYFEFEGDLYWLNKNNRGQLFLNVREKPRPAFRVTPVRKLDPADPAAAELAAEHQADVDRRTEQRRQQEEREAALAAKAEAAKAAKAAAREAREARETADALPNKLPQTGDELLAVLRPRMRQNRRGGGFSGSTSYLAKALRQSEADLVAALAAVGLKPSAPDGEKSPQVEIGGHVYWLNQDNRGGYWINGREKREGDEAAAPGAQGPGGEESDAVAAPDGAASADAPVASPAGEAPAVDDTSDGDEADGNVEDDPVASDETSGPVEPVELRPDDNVLEVLRRLLKPNKRGSGASAEVGYLARAVGKPAIEVLELLVKVGCAVPDDAKDKPVHAEQGDDTFWISRHPRNDTLWLNAKPKAANRRRGGRGRRRPEGVEAESAGTAAGEAAPANENASLSPPEVTATPPAAESAPEGAGRESTERS
jgi:hypothetical protein